MAIAVGSVIKRVDLGQASMVEFTFTFSGSYATPGESLASAFSGFDFKTTKQPLFLLVTGIAGYVYVYDRAANKLKVYTSGANAQDALAELSDGAYPGGVTGDTVTAIGFFQKL